MRKHWLLVGATLVALGWCAPLDGAQFEHPDLKSGKKVVQKVVILPAQVQVTKSGVKGAEPLIEESQQVEAALPGVVNKVFSERGCTVVENPFTPQALEKDQDLKYALADLQGKFDTLRKQLDQKPKDVRKGRFTLGDEVAKFNPGASADALVFVRGEGVISTGGKKAFATIFGGISGAAATADRLEVHIAVVDAQTGAILYYGRATATGNFRDPEKLLHPIQNSFKNFVGPAAPSKKTTAG
jgi:hypothetical protein